MIQRKGIIVFYQSPKVIAEVERLGVHVTYKNENRNYLAGYVDATQFDKIKKLIETVKNVRKVEESLADMKDLDFED
ncbi:MAG TPA: hypothetical protein DCR44_04220 [Acholeplasmatales bacterium]|nr:hypothetical protein [Acholeplasmatales bacterium]